MNNYPEIPQSIHDNTHQWEYSFILMHKPLNCGLINQKIYHLYSSGIKSCNFTGKTS